jgi:hypothetical protein
MIEWSYRERRMMSKNVSQMIPEERRTILLNTMVIAWILNWVQIWKLVANEVNSVTMRFLRDQRMGAGRPAMNHIILRNVSNWNMLVVIKGLDCVKIAKFYENSSGLLWVRINMFVEMIAISIEEWII